MTEKTMTKAAACRMALEELGFPEKTVSTDDVIEFAKDRCKLTVQKFDVGNAKTKFRGELGQVTKRRGRPPREEATDTEAFEAAGSTVATEAAETYDENRVFEDGPAQEPVSLRMEQPTQGATGNGDDLETLAGVIKRMGLRRVREVVHLSEILMRNN